MDIFSTVADSDESYAYYSGTSMATPHVAGVMALLLTHDGSLDATQAKARLLNTSMFLDSLRDRTVSGGLVNAGNALDGADDGSLAAQAGSAAWALAAAIGFTAESDSTPQAEDVNEVVLVCFSAAHWDGGDAAAELRLKASASHVRGAAEEERGSDSVILGAAAAGTVMVALMAMVLVRRRQQAKSSEWVRNNSKWPVPSAGGPVASL